MFDAIDKKGNGLESDTQEESETPAAILGTEAIPWERFCAVVPPSTEKEPEGLTEPVTVPKEGEGR